METIDNSYSSNIFGHLQREWTQSLGDDQFWAPSPVFSFCEWNCDMQISSHLRRILLHSHSMDCHKGVGPPQIVGDRPGNEFPLMATISWTLLGPHFLESN